MGNRVDVIIPCYQYGHFLQECVESVLTQDGVDVRVLIIDDASTDNTAEIAENFSARDKRVEFLKHRANRGHIRTYNEGLEWASADYLLLLSADDMLTPGALRRAASLLASHPEVGLTYGPAIVLRERRGKPSLRQTSLGWQILKGDQFLEYMCKTGGNPVPTPTAIVRTAVQKKIGGYRLELPHTGDMEMWMRFAVQGDIGIIKACQAYYRRHGDNMQIKYQQSALEDLPECKRAFDVIFTTYADKIWNVQQLRDNASSGLAKSAFWRASIAFDRGDLNAYRECLEFAAEICPEIVSSHSWTRLSYKVFLGSIVWSWLRPLADWARGISSCQESTEAGAAVIGWWPEENSSPLTHPRL